MTEVYGVIMAGGSGSRFWPLSRKALPKQFLNFAGEDSMLVATAKRCLEFLPQRNIIVTTGEAYGELTKAYLPWLAEANLILEPCNRDTAPCIALALKKIMVKHPEAVVCFLPADHLIKNTQAFVEDLQRALQLAVETKKIITLGIKPSYPATAYGYLSCGLKVQNYYECNGFVEKPNQSTAEALIGQKNKLWNSGIFVGMAKVLWEHFKNQQKEIVDLLTNNQDPIGKIYKNMPKISIDYGIMEKLTKGEILILPANFDWDDLGSFTALNKVWQQDEAGNCCSDQIKLLTMASKNCVVAGEGGLIALLGVEDLLVIEHDGVLLIAAKEQAQEIKTLVTALATQGEDKYL